MSEWIVDVTSSVTIKVNDPEAIERVTGDGGAEWRSYFYDLHTEEDVMTHWAYNAMANRVERVNRLDGWADLPDDAVTFEVDPAVEMIAVVPA